MRNVGSLLPFKLFYVNLNPYAAEPFWDIACIGPTCSVQRVKENFYLQFMSAHPRMPEFLKTEIDSTNNMHLGKKSLANSIF